MNENKSKLKKVISILLILLLIALVICGIMIIRKVSIFNSLISASEVTSEKTNYKIQKSVMQGNEIEQKIEGFVMGEKYYQVAEHIFQDGSVGVFISYNVGEGDFLAVAMGDNKTHTEGHPPIFVPNAQLFRDYVNTANVFEEVLKSKIKSVESEGKECYEIALESGRKFLVEKDTGLIIQSVEGDRMATTTYEFDIVTDSDIQEPDLTGYTEL